MRDLPHLRITENPNSIDYTYAGGMPSGKFELPPRPSRSGHAKKLKADIAALQVEIEGALGHGEIEGVSITVRSDPGFELRLESLERKRDGIQLLSVKQEDDVMSATLFVPYAKMSKLVALIDSYEKELEKRSKTKAPKNKLLIESISEIRLTAVKSLWTDTTPFPRSSINWWEAWLRAPSSKPEADQALAEFRRLTDELGITLAKGHIRFPERIVVLFHASAVQIGKSIQLIAAIAELRRAKQVASDFHVLPSSEQALWVDAFLRRLKLPSKDVPSVCVLDTGVNRGHPLLSPFLAPEDTQAVDSTWGTSDHDADQHGTGMAGLALFGDLAEALAASGAVQQTHRLESVKILPPPPKANEREMYGDLTSQAFSLAEIAAPNRNRAFCIAITADDTDQGLPSSWSAALDQLCAPAADGSHDAALAFVAAGNVRDLLTNKHYEYLKSNLKTYGVEDPGQSWNVITVGAFTERVLIKNPALKTWTNLAPPGDLCPSSRTSHAWPKEHHKWPYKPDFVLEGGNYATNGKNIDREDDLSLLTTQLTKSSLFSFMSDTSAATAQAARMAAILWNAYPTLWPETIRALLVHSSRWSKAMMARFPGNKTQQVYNRLRCFGYGVPSLAEAMHSASNAATLVYEGELQPYQKNPTGSDIKTKEMHLHQLPWPIDLLENLGATPVTMRVTLSYFVEPSPAKVGWGKNQRYQSHGLRFDVIRPEESVNEFKKRISRAEWEESEGEKQRPQNVSETRKWAIRDDGRRRGSIHSDWWTGTAAQLAACGKIAVYPVTGWWRERKHLNRFDSRARYSLIVSIETSSVSVDLYTPIKAQIAVVSELET